MEWRRNTVLVVDDTPINRLILRGALSPSYPILEAESGAQALELVKSHSDELAAILLDVVMPDMDGITVLKKLNEDGWLNLLPIFLVTAESTGEVVMEGYRAGATDVIAKPFAPDVILERISNAIELYRHRNNLLGQPFQSPALPLNAQTMLDSLCAAVQREQCLTSGNAEHIRLIVRLLLSSVMLRHPDYQLTSEIIENASRAATLLDVGKLAIDEQILKCPNKLSVAEFAQMQQHTLRGRDLLNRLCPDMDPAFRQYAVDICLHHHERFSGTGYPERLKGSDITIWAQAAGLADAYEALVSKRPYRSAYSHAQALNMVVSGKCGIFNPVLLECLHLIVPQMQEFIYNSNESK